MSASISGVPQLRARIEAIKPNEKLMRRVALLAIREQKILVPRKTSTLSRTIHIGAVTPTRAETIASANYAVHVERGTGKFGPKKKKYEIKPREGRVGRGGRPAALRFAASPSGARLSGSPKKGARVRFARRVMHPGSKAQPFMVPGARKAIEAAGLKNFIVASWNEAA